MPSTTTASSENYQLFETLHTREPKQLRYFSSVVALSQIFAFIVLFLTGYWNGVFNGGYVWGSTMVGPDGKLTVNEQYGHFHFTFQTYAMIFLQGEAIIMYRLFRHERKLFSKFLHGGFHLSAIVLAVFGIIAIIKHKNVQGNAHMWSSHSWMGAIVLACFIAQYIAGFFAFAFPKAGPASRKVFLPVHRNIGLFLFGISAVVVLMGYEGYTVMLIKGESSFGAGFSQCMQHLNCAGGQALVLNFNQIFLALYVICVLFITMNPNYRRMKTIDE